MAHMKIPAPRTSAPPISTAGMSRAFVKMLEDAVRRGDHAEALKITRGAETHFAFLTAEGAGK